MWNALLAIAAIMGTICDHALAAEFTGQVQGAHSPIAGSTVTLYAAGSGAPAQLAQGKTDANGAFSARC